LQFCLSLSVCVPHFRQVCWDLLFAVLCSNISHFEQVTQESWQHHLLLI